MRISLPLLDFLIDAILIAGPFLYITLFERKPALKELGFKSNGAAKDINATAKLFLCLFIYSALISLALSALGLNDIEKVGKVIGTLVQAPPLYLLYFFLVRVLGEEIFFRAFLVPRIGIIPSSIAFGLLHFGYWSVSEMVGAALLGIILAVAYKQNKTIVPNYIAHLLYNLVAVLLLVNA